MQIGSIFLIARLPPRHKGHTGKPSVCPFFCVQNANCPQIRPRDDVYWRWRSSYVGQQRNYLGAGLNFSKCPAGSVNYRQGQISGAEQARTKRPKGILGLLRASVKEPDMPSTTLELPAPQTEHGGTSQNNLDLSALDALRGMFLLLDEWERKAQCACADANNQEPNGIS